MSRTLLILLFCLMTPAAATAGAWLRDKGKTFVSVQTALRQSGQQYFQETDVYVDYGLQQRLSAGFALFDDGNRSGHALVFLRHPLRWNDEKTNIAVEYGVGLHYAPLRRQAMYRVTFAYGRGFRWGDGYGWVNIDTTLEKRTIDPGLTLKADATIGQSTGRKVRPMFKIGLEQAQNASLTWAASAHLMLDGPSGITWLAGIEQKQSGNRSTAISLGVWRKF